VRSQPSRVRRNARNGRGAPIKRSHPIAGPMKHPLLTAHLMLRRWREADREPFARMNADPLVMRYFLASLTRAESDALIDRIEARIQERGWGLYAAELRETGRFIGFIGLSSPGPNLPIYPCVEIGWRLDAEFWNQGLATEGAREVLRHADEELNVPEIVSFTAAINMPSRRVMEKIGLTRDVADDFDHPGIAEGHPLRRHVLYRKKAQKNVTAGRGTEHKS